MKGRFWQKYRINQRAFSVTLKYLALTVWEKKDTDHLFQISRFENPRKRGEGAVFAKVCTLRKI